MTDSEDNSIETNPPSGPDGVDDIWVGDDGNHAYDALGEIQRIYDEFMEVMEAVDGRAKDADDLVVLKPEERTLLLEFYTVVHAHLERLTSIILYEAIGKRETDAASILSFFRDEFTQSKREDLLYNMGVIDDGLKGELTKVRRVRNQIVHSQHRRMYINPNKQSQSDVKRAKDTVDKVEQLLKEVIGSSDDGF